MPTIVRARVSKEGNINEKRSYINCTTDNQIPESPLTQEETVCFAVVSGDVKFRFLDNDLFVLWQERLVKAVICNFYFIFI